MSFSEPYAQRLKRLELIALSASSVVAAFGLGLCRESMSMLGVALLVNLLQVLRGFDKPLLGPKTALMTSMVAAGALLAELKYFKNDLAVSLATFLLAIQWILICSQREGRGDGQILVINLIILGVTAVVVIDAIFAFYLLAFIFTVVHCLNLRRLGQRLKDDSWTLRIVRDEQAPHKSQSEYENQGLAGVLLLNSGLAMITALGTILLFLCLPRGSGQLLAIPSRAQSRQTRFNNSVSLDRGGLIKKNHAPAMRVEVIEGVVPKAPYFRGCVFDIYWSRRWHQAVPEWQGDLEDPASDFEYLVGNWRDRPDTELVFHVFPLPVQALFCAGPTRRVRFALGGPKRIHYGLHNELFTRKRRHSDLVYRTQSWWQRPQRSRRGPAARIIRNRCLTIPNTISRVQLMAISHDMLRKQGALNASVEDKVRALTSYLVQNYSYTLDITDSGDIDPLLFFLMSSRRGHCELFASSLVLLLRVEGIPARLINGFHGGEYNPEDKSFLVRQSNAHAWVEAEIPGEGWVTVDPTPPEEQLTTEKGSVQQLRDWLDSKWSRHVVSYSRMDQSSFFKKLGRVTDRLLGRETPPENSSQSQVKAEDSDPWWPYVLAGLLALIWLSWRLRRRVKQSITEGDWVSNLKSREALLALFAECERRGLKRQSGETAREYYHRACGRWRGVLEAALFEDYERLRFGLRARSTQVIDRDAELGRRIHAVKQKLLAIKT